MTVLQEIIKDLEPHAIMNPMDSIYDQGMSMGYENAIHILKQHIPAATHNSTYSPFLYFAFSCCHV